MWKVFFRLSATKVPIRKIFVHLCANETIPHR